MAGIKTKVRMYKLNELGDCFQLSFTKAAKTTNILIDCGTFRNSGVSKKRIEDVLKEVYKVTNKKALDVVVATHQHNDHVSGFTHSFTTFRKFGIKEAWLSWLDDPKDPQAKKIGKAHKNLAGALTQLAGMMPTPKKIVTDKDRLIDRLKDISGFYLQGVAEVPRKGIENLKKMAERTSYLDPGQILEVPGFTSKEIKVYVLGPPRNETDLYDINPSKDESYDKELGRMELSLNRYMSALSAIAGNDERSEYNYPFDQCMKIKKGEWDKMLDKEFLKEIKNETWRDISNEWLQSLESMALYLDTYTNNSSLVLAFELVKEKKVLLFVGDAQTGNWTSWKTIKWKKAGDGAAVLEDLLSKTVLYKVGHHASHNATLKEALEKMTNPELVAMIPVNKNDPNITKPNGWKMPASNLYKRLKQVTANRVLRMDSKSGYADQCDPATSAAAKKSWGKVKKVVNSALWVEVEV
jgi:beta-lactamase superfamily II metal-dependent hydrolase